MVARPDPSTFRVLPWETSGGEHYSARMFCDIAMPDGSPSWADPRHVLRRALSKAGEAGFTCYVHPEIEFYLLHDLPSDGSAPTPADQGGYFDQASHDAAPHFPAQRHRDPGVDGISVEFSRHEGGPGQQEIDLRYADALTMADNIMTFRYVVMEVAITQGVSPGKSSTRRVEIRKLDTACNPYLAFVVIPGLQGIAKGYELGAPTEDDVWSLTETERKAIGYESLPQNLTEALGAMEHSELVAEILGEHVFDFFLRNKRQEWDGYRRQVTPNELVPTW